MNDSSCSRGGGQPTGSGNTRSTPVGAPTSAATAALPFPAPPPYHDSRVGFALSRAPFDAFCKLDTAVDGKANASRHTAGGLPAKPLIRGRYDGLCATEPTQRQAPERLESFLCGPLPVRCAVTGEPLDCFRVNPCFLDERAAEGAGHASSLGKRLTDERDQRRRTSLHTPARCVAVPAKPAVFQVEPFSRSSAGKVLEPEHLRTPLALEKSMHFLVEYYLRSPHTPLAFTDPFKIWGYLWDRLRSIRTTWVPQLPLCSAGFCNYKDEANNRLLNPDVLAKESRRRMQWLEFTVAALSVGAAYLCRTVEGCRRFVQEKKNFLESISQCFTDLTVWYRAEQRSRHAEFVSLLLLLYGLSQESKAEDRALFCTFVKLEMSDGSTIAVPEPAGASVNLSQVYSELQKLPHLIDTQPVKTALKLIHTWGDGHWFEFFHLCQHECLTPLQRAFLFQSFTYARFRAVLDLVVPTNPAYPKQRLRNAIRLSTLSDGLMMQETGHCVSFLTTMGLGELVDEANDVLRVSNPSSVPLITASTIEERCTNKAHLLFPTHAAFFGFHVWEEAFELFPQEPFCESDRDAAAQLRAATERLHKAKTEAFLRGGDTLFTMSDPNIQREAARREQLERRLLRTAACPVNVMEILERYCPPYNEDVARLPMEDLPLPDDVVFGALPAHREAMLLRSFRRASPAGPALLLAASEKASAAAARVCAQVEADAADMLDAFEDESAVTEADLFDDGDEAAPHAPAADAAAVNSTAHPDAKASTEEQREGALGDTDADGDGTPASILSSRALVDSLAHDDVYERVRREMEEAAAARNADEERRRQEKEALLQSLKAKLQQQQQQQQQQPDQEKDAATIHKTSGDDEETEGDDRSDFIAREAGGKNEERKDRDGEEDACPSRHSSSGVDDGANGNDRAPPGRQPVLALPAVGRVIVTPLPADYTSSSSHPATPAVATAAIVETPQSTTLPTAASRAGFPSQPSTAPVAPLSQGREAHPPIFEHPKEPTRWRAPRENDNVEEVDVIAPPPVVPTPFSFPAAGGSSKAADGGLFRSARPSSPSTNATPHPPPQQQQQPSRSPVAQVDTTVDSLTNVSAISRNLTDSISYQSTGAGVSFDITLPHEHPPRPQQQQQQRQRPRPVEESRLENSSSALAESTPPRRSGTAQWNSQQYAEFSHLKATRRSGSSSGRSSGGEDDGADSAGASADEGTRRASLHGDTAGAAGAGGGGGGGGRTAVRPSDAIPRESLHPSATRRTSPLPVGMGSRRPHRHHNHHQSGPERPPLSSSSPSSFFEKGFAVVVADFLVAAAQQLSSRAGAQRALRYAALCAAMARDGATLSAWRRGLFFGPATSPAPTDRSSSGGSRLREASSYRSRFFSPSTKAAARAPRWTGLRVLQEEDVLARRMCVGFALAADAPPSPPSAHAAQKRQRTEEPAGGQRSPQSVTARARHRGASHATSWRATDVLASAWAGVARAMPPLPAAAAAAEANPARLLAQLEDTLLPAVVTSTPSWCPADAPASAASSSSPLDSIVQALQQLGSRIANEQSRQGWRKRVRERDGETARCGGAALHPFSPAAPSTSPPSASATTERVPSHGSGGRPWRLHASFVLISSEGSPLGLGFARGEDERGNEEGAGGLCEEPRVALARQFRDLLEHAVASLLLCRGDAGTTQALPHTRLAHIAFTRPLLYLSPGADAARYSDAASHLVTSHLRTSVSVHAMSSAALSTALHHTPRAMPRAAPGTPTSPFPFIRADDMCPQVTPILCFDTTPEEPVHDRARRAADDAEEDSLSSPLSLSSAASGFFSPTRWSKLLQTIDRVVKHAALAEAADRVYTPPPKPFSSQSYRRQEVVEEEEGGRRKEGEAENHREAVPTRIPGVLILVRVPSRSQGGSGSDRDRDKAEEHRTFAAVRTQMHEAVALSWRQQAKALREAAAGRKSAKKAATMPPPQDPSLCWRHALQQPNPTGTDTAASRQWAPRNLRGEPVVAAVPSPTPSSAAAAAGDDDRGVALPMECPLTVTIVPVYTSTRGQLDDADDTLALQRALMDGVYALLCRYHARVIAAVNPASDMAGRVSGGRGGVSRSRGSGGSGGEEESRRYSGLSEGPSPLSPPGVSQGFESVC